MKKLLLILVAFALFQNWNKLENFFRPEPAEVATQGEVVLYATSWCGYCEKTRQLLTAENVSYVEYDIEKSAEGLRQYEALNGRGVPVLKVGRTVVHGYNETDIRELLK
jgi:glutaredoxin